MISQPRTFVLTIERPMKRFQDTAAHLDSLGIKWEPFYGMDNLKCRLDPVDTFDYDKVGEHISPKHIAATLTHYLCWKVMSYLPDDTFWVFEHDVRLPEDWRERFEQIMQDVPEDWDIIFIGNCCCAGRPTTHIKGEVYEVKYPLCGHGIMYKKTAFDVLLSVHQRIAEPLDIAMFLHSLPLLRVYTILPTLVTQAGTPLPP